MKTILVFLVCLVAVSVEAGQSPRIAGVVLDTAGAPVAGASVSGSGASTTTADDGSFVLANLPTGPVTVVVSAPGFAAASQLFGGATETARVVLYSVRFADSIVVTPSRGAARVSTPAATTVVNSADLLMSAAGSLDDALRSTPGFSLFRRSSSRVANPTTQGVTLRGVSGSGASRTMVLADGTPLNDPFGSWVYWNRIPQTSIERVEVLRGATGDLYGADALGGVVQVLTFAPNRTQARASLDGGSLGTARFSGFGSTQYRQWHVEGAGEWLRTDGYVVIAEDERGPKDTAADSDYGSGFVGAGYDQGTWHGKARVSFYSEDRNNGTAVQVNSTDWTQVSAEAGGGVGSGVWLARGAGGSQDYYQTFSAVFGSGGVNRAAERLTTEQTTNSDFFNMSAQWAGRWTDLDLLAGIEGKRTDSTLEQFAYLVGGAVIGPTLLGGVETASAVFGRMSLAPRDDLTVVLGARGDFWDSTPLDATQAPHSANFLSPRASLAWQFSETMSFQTSAYRAYRTPTLNELHRGFRVGNIVTNANPLLEPERLTGIEGGVLVTIPRGSVRVAAFTNQLSDAVANVTLSVTPSLITRQRQNTDSVRASGIEIEADVRPAPRWALGLLLAVTRSTFSTAPSQPEIEGNRIPQVPTFQVGGSITYVDPRGFTGALQARALGSQFDDDLNDFELDGFGVIDLTANQELRRGVNVFLAVENLFDKEYDVASSPRSIGWPRTARIGVRVFLP
jgi:outer membrane receptor protein involved in Fe transport